MLHILKKYVMQWWVRLGVGKFGCLCVGMGRQWGGCVCGKCWNVKTSSLRGVLKLTFPRKVLFQKTSPAQLTTEQSGLIPVWTFDGILCFSGLISTPNKLNLGKLGNIVSKIRRADNASRQRTATWQRVPATERMKSWRQCFLKEDVMKLKMEVIRTTSLCHFFCLIANCR